jgi:hypothetical protein
MFVVCKSKTLSTLNTAIVSVWVTIV